MAKFDMLCKNYGIIHQSTTPQWPQHNRMVERMTKTLKHGLTVVSENIQLCDIQVPKILFGYHCGIQSSTKYSSYMILTGIIPRLNIDNQPSNLTQVINDQVDPKDLALQMIFKMKLIIELHESLLENVD